MQGQSMFGAEGDTGAFSCIRSDGTTILNVLDPPSQPWVTSVGGTSFENFNPGANPNPTYPTGQETVWNVLNLCNAAAADEDGLSGFFWCAGDRRRRRRQQPVLGPAVLPVRPGRQQPVHSARQRHHRVRPGQRPARRAARTRTSRPTPTSTPPYAEFCTGNANTPYSVCGTFSDTRSPPGWFGDRRHQPVVAAVVRHRRRPRQLPGLPHRQPEPAALHPRTTSPRTSTSTTSPARARRHQQRPLPDHQGLRRGNRNRHPEHDRPDH